MQTMNDEKGKRIGVRRSLAVGTIRDTLMIYNKTLDGARL